jgi:hypothetical protein
MRAKFLKIATSQLLFTLTAAHARRVRRTFSDSSAAKPLVPRYASSARSEIPRAVCRAAVGQPGARAKGKRNAITARRRPKEARRESGRAGGGRMQEWCMNGYGTGTNRKGARLPEAARSTDGQSPFPLTRTRPTSPLSSPHPLRLAAHSAAHA